MSGFTLVIGDKKKKSELPIAKNTVRFALIGVCFLVTSCSQTPSPKLITYNTPKGIQIQALYALPETSFGTSVPAIVYNHGRLIHGNDFKRSAQLGYDISHFVDRFAAEGYATIAPIRETSNSREQNEDMLEGVFQFLKNQKRIDTSKIGMVGFSLRHPHLPQNIQGRSDPGVNPTNSSASKSKIISTFATNGLCGCARHTGKN